MTKILKQYIGANSWFYNLYIASANYKGIEIISYEKIYKLFQNTFPPFQIPIVYTVATLPFQPNKRFENMFLGTWWEVKAVSSATNIDARPFITSCWHEGESMHRLDYAEFVGVFYVLRGECIAYLHSQGLGMWSSGGMNSENES